MLLTVGELPRDAAGTDNIAVPAPDVSRGHDPVTLWQHNACAVPFTTSHTQIVEPVPSRQCFLQVSHQNIVIDRGVLNKPVLRSLAGLPLVPRTCAWSAFMLASFSKSWPSTSAERPW